LSFKNNNLVNSKVFTHMSHYKDSSKLTKVRKYRCIYIYINNNNIIDYNKPIIYYSSNIKFSHFKIIKITQMIQWVKMLVRYRKYLNRTDKHFADNFENFIHLKGQRV